MPEQRWVRVVGDGLAYEGACLLRSVIFWPDADADYADIYDGRDSSSGKKLCRIESGDSNTLALDFGEGIPFNIGIYIDGVDSAVQTTVVFHTLA